MTKEEFFRTCFGKGDKAIYKGKEHLIKSVDFEESLLAIITPEALEFQEDDEDDSFWVRCENIEFKPAQP